jgi:hypothetical protein
MSGESDRDESAFVKQTGLSVEAIEVTLRQHDRALGDISRKINDMGSQAAAQSAALRTELLGSIAGLSTELRAQQKAAIDNSRTPWIQLVIACVTVGGFVWAVGRGAISPLEDNQVRMDHAAEKFVDKVDQDFKQVYLTLTPILSTSEQIKTLTERVANDEQAINTKWSKDAQAEYVIGQNKVWNLEHEYAVRDLGRVEAANAVTAADEIKRPEIQSALGSIVNQLTSAIANENERYTALSTRANDMQREFGANFTLGDAVKELQARVNQFFTSSSSAPMPPTK